MGDDELLKKNKKSRLEDEAEGLDRLSRLPDELIHRILSYLEAQVAVELCILSKRWKYVWKTLPFLDFSNYKKPSLPRVTKTKFVESFLSRRNHQLDILHMKLFIKWNVPSRSVSNLVTYAIRDNVQNLDFRLSHNIVSNIKLSTFNSISLKELKFDMGLLCNDLSESDCWQLPSLTNLDMSWSSFDSPRKTYKLPESCLICLSSLKTLSLVRFELPNSVTLPTLTTLNLRRCKLPKKFWDLPALLNLTLSVQSSEHNLSEFFPALVNLQNLTLFLYENILTDFLIMCPQLVNLEIITSMTTTTSPLVKIIVLAPKIRNFSSHGFFTITFGDSELENVDVKLEGNSRYIKLEGNSRYKDIAPSNKLKDYYLPVEQMFVGLGSARILALDLETIKALTVVQDFLVDSPPPFYNLKYVKIPTSYKESCISACLKGYLLGRCPEALIVNTLPQSDLVACSKVASVRAQHVAPQVPLAAPTKELIDSENTPKSLSVDTVDMGGQKEHVAHNSVIHAEDTGNDQVISSMGNRDSGLWRGHEVNSKFVCLLDLIINKYPETFSNFTAKSKKVCTMKLNMLCTLINEFTKISLTEVTTEMIADYRNVFADLQDLGFNLTWLVSRLNYIEQLRFSQPLIPQLHAIDCHIGYAKNNLKILEIRVNDTKTELQDLQTRRAEKMQEIQKAFGAMGTNLAVGNIGDHLFNSDP